MKDQIMIELNSVFQVVLGDSKLKITKDMNPNSIDSWDSITQVTLISAIEKKFDVSFEFSEVLELTNVGEIYKILKQKLENRKNN